MTTRYKQPVSVLVVIYTAPSPFDASEGPGQAQDIQVLLLERADHPGFWQSVTGSCEAGETLIETVLREVSEETGLDVRQYLLTDWHTQNVYEIYPHWRYRYQPGTTLNTEHVYGLQLPHPLAVRLAPREHLNYQWLTWQDAASIVFSPSNRAAILQLAERAGFDRLKQEIITFADRSFWASNEHETLSLGVIQNVDAILVVTGFDLSRFNRRLDNFGARHIFKKHGVETVEEKRGQRAVVSTDFALIPEIVNNPDQIEYAGQSRFSKADLIKFQKRIGDETYFYVEEIRRKRRVVATETMWIRR